MNFGWLFWIYLANAVVLINHEIDSAYWQEWKLLNPDDKSGINGFLILHIPMLFFLLLGLVLVFAGKPAGNIISIFVCAGGIFAFFFHYYHLRKGNPSFNTLISKTLIITTFLLSLIQLIITVYQIVK